MKLSQNRQSRFPFRINFATGLLTQILDFDSTSKPQLLSSILKTMTDAQDEETFQPKLFVS